MSDASFGELRSLAHGAPSPEAWALMCPIIEDLHARDPDAFVSSTLPYLQDLLDDRWPQDLLTPPSSWSNHPTLLSLTPHPGARYLISQRRAASPPNTRPPLLPEAVDPWAPILEASHILPDRPARVCSLLDTPRGLLSLDVNGHLCRWRPSEPALLAHVELPLEAHEEARSLHHSALGTLVLLHAQEDACASWRALLLDPELEVSWSSPATPGDAESCALSPDRAHLLVSLTEETPTGGGIQVYTRHPWALLTERRFEHTQGSFHNFCVHPNGTHVVAVEQTSMEAFELVTNATTLELPEESWTLHAAYSPSGSFFLTTFEDVLHLWDTRTGALQRAPSHECDFRHNISHDERYLCMSALYVPNPYCRHVVLDLHERRTLGQVFSRTPDLAHLSPMAVCDGVFATANGRTLRLHPLDPPHRTFDLAPIDATYDLSDTLERLNASLFSEADSYELEWLEQRDPEALASRWLGFAGASEQEIREAESRLGRRLPPSFVAFLRASNGWRNLSGFPIGICTLLGTQDLFWAREQRVMEWWRDQHQTYHDLDPSSFFPWPELDNMLVIGDGDGNEYLLLNPSNQRDDGEWEVWEFHKECGFGHFSDFHAFLEVWI